jgi:putative hydrolase of the HAD superfamily
MIRCVVFDLGTVLSSPPDLYRAPAALLEVDPGAYEALYWRYRPAYDAGGSRVEYWQPILEELGLQPTGELITELADLDVRLWMEIRPGALDLLQTVDQWPVRTAILSNAPFAFAHAMRDARWAPFIDRVFISAEIGLTKPDPAIFAATNDELGVAPDEVAFIDDRRPNVEAAQAFGWNSHLWVDDTDSLAWLTAVCGR